MKVLSIKQPYASLIKEGIKKYEIRSRKTNYRGELFIHASLSKINKNNTRKNELVKLLKDKDLKYGHIIIKCKLKDCIYIDKTFLDIMRKDAPRDLYTDDFIGYYAWVIEDVEILENIIPAKGQLGIWNFEL